MRCSVRILAFDTTGKNASVSYRNELGEITSLHSDEGYNHLTSLMPMIQKSVGDGGIDIIAVSAGPGSFTGIRIGISTARALMQGLKVPGMGVKTLESFLYGMHPSKEYEKTEHTEKKIRILCPIFDARREEIYGATYVIGSIAGICADILPEARVLPGIPALCAIDECAEPLAVFLTKLRNLIEILLTQKEKLKKDVEISIEFYGDGVDRYRDRIDEFFAFDLNGERKISICYADEEHRYQRAEWVMRCAEAYMNSKETLNQTLIFDPEKLLPNYLRRAEAERNLAKKRENGD